MSTRDATRRGLACWPRGWRWCSLFLLSVLAVLTLRQFRLPAALLLGPMLAAILFAGANARLRMASRPFMMAQGVIGSMIATHIPSSVLGEMAGHSMVFGLGVTSVLLASAALGWSMSRMGVLPGSTALWGSTPGAASAMVLMAGAFGADMRLVAFMQYLRVVLVALVAAVLTRCLGGHAGAAATVWITPLHGWRFAGTLALSFGGALLGQRLRVPAGPLLLPLLLGIAFDHAGWLHLELPVWLLAISYAVVGWSIGLRFDRALLIHVLHVFPRVLLGILALIAVCGGLSEVLVAFAGVDPLTAYLAMSPGGADSVAIIAASSRVDLPFVMAMQTARFVLVLLLGPLLARLLASRMRKGKGEDLS